MRNMMPPGCLALILFALALLFIPFMLADVFLSALTKLGLSAEQSAMAAAAIFMGGMFNLPIKRIERDEPLQTGMSNMFGMRQFSSPEINEREVVLSVNIGGCVVPVLLAGYQIMRLWSLETAFFGAALLAIVINIGVCYYMAQPVPNVGIAMQPFVPALTAVACALILTPSQAPAVAFAAGVLGPLIGADLMHLDDISKISTGMASIGGAGTFDGIVLSGIVATLLA